MWLCGVVLVMESPTVIALPGQLQTNNSTTFTFLPKRGRLQHKNSQNMAKSDQKLAKKRSKMAKKRTNSMRLQPD
jgi:hypothetical protein